MPDSSQTLSCAQCAAELSAAEADCPHCNPPRPMEFARTELLLAPGAVPPPAPARDTPSPAGSTGFPSGARAPGTATRCAACASGLGAGESACPLCGETPRLEFARTEVLIAPPSPVPPRGAARPDGAKKPPSGAIDLAPGVEIAGRYRIESPLGRGGMGVVYKCVDGRLDEPVAVKLLAPEAASNPEKLERFTREIRLVRRLNHKAIVPSYDFGEWRGMRYIVMRYVDGQSLAQLLKLRGRIETKEYLALAAQLAEGLKAAHDEGIIHRDLKPENILVDARGGVYVLDFGIARRMHEARMTVAGAIFGTPHYMAPEQAQGLDTDHRTDIYAFGVIGYELLSGRQPITGQNTMETLVNQMRQIPAPLGELAPGVPRHVSAAIMRCLAKAPGDRFADILEALEALLTEPLPDDAELPGEAVVPAAPAAPAVRRLLVIDPRPDLAEALRGSFAGEPVDVLAAADGGSGAELAFSGSPDAILMHLNTPGIDGLTLARLFRLRYALRNTAIFCLHEAVNPQYAALAGSLGIDGFLPRSAGADAIAGSVRGAWQTRISSGAG